MKRILIIFICLICFLGAKAQYPITQNLGSSKTLVDALGGMRGKFINAVYADTTAANLDLLFSYYNGAQIVTYSGGVKFWVRYNNKWYISSGSGTSGWSLGGNALTNSALEYFGSNNNNDVNFGTNGLKRFSLSSSGVLPSAATVKPLGIDSVSGYLSYSSVIFAKNAGSGSDSLAYADGDTLKFKRPVAGYGITLTTALTTNTYKIDTPNISTRAYAQKILNDTAAVLRALIGSGGVVDTFWTARHNANHYPLDTLSRLSVFRTLVSAGTNTYATWNPSDKASGITLSGGNLTAQGSSGALEMVRATIGFNSGKYYWEETIVTTGNHKVGISNLSESVNTTLGDGAGSYGYQADGQKKNNGTTAAYGATYGAGDVIGVLVDLIAGTITFYKNNVSQGIAYTGISGTFYPAHSFGFTNVTATVNFGASSFVYSVPSGYNAGVYTTSGSTTAYSPVLSTDTSGHVFIGAQTGTAGLNINRSLSINIDSVLLNSNITDTVLKINASTNKIERVIAKNIGNSDLKLTGNRTLTQASNSLVFDGSGNVGFGILTTPIFKLHLKDNLSSPYGILIENISANGSAYGALAFYNDNGSGSRAGIIKNSSINSSYAGINSLNILQNTTEPIGFITNNLLRMIIDGNGKVGIGLSSPSALLHITGTGAANGAPLKTTSVSLLSSAEAGAFEYNGSQYFTKASGLRYSIGGIVADFTTTVDNTSTTETDLYSYTTPANTLANTGEKLFATYGGTFNDVTSTGQIQAYFAGTNIGNTGALTISATGGWSMTITIIRTGSSTARSVLTITTPGASTTLYTSQTDITGITFSNTNILKITGTAGGATGGTGDISAKLGSISWYGIAAN